MTCGSTANSRQPNKYVVHKYIVRLYFLLLIFFNASYWKCIHASRCTCDDSQQFGVKLMERSLAVGATSGSLSAILFRFLSSALDSPCPVFDCDCDCPVCFDFPALIIQKLDIFSLLVGIICGLLIGPILDLVHLLRQSWVVWLCSRLNQLAGERPLYKLA